jgi:hypothetical protein
MKAETKGAPGSGRSGSGPPGWPGRPSKTSLLLTLSPPASYHQVFSSLSPFRAKRAFPMAK